MQTVGPTGVGPVLARGSVCGNAAALWRAFGSKSGAPSTQVAIRAARAAARATRLGAHSTVMRPLPPLGASTGNPGARNQPRGAGSGLTGRRCESALLVSYQVEDLGLGYAGQPR